MQMACMRSVSQNSSDAGSATCPACERPSTWTQQLTSLGNGLIATEALGGGFSAAGTPVMTGLIRIDWVVVGRRRS